MMLKRTLVLLFGLCLSPLALAGVSIQHWIAPTGAKVYFIETQVLPILDVQFDFPAGNAYSPAAKAGLGSLTQGLLDTGAGNLNEEQIAERLVDTGAKLSGGVDNDKASITLRTLTSKPERDAALELLRTVLSAPTFPTDALERERTRTIAGIREAATRPDAIAAKRFAREIYPGHPYGEVPTEESIAAITRDDLMAFHQSRYAARGAVVSMIGAISRAEAEAIAVQLTAGLPAGDAVAPLPAVTKPKRSLVKVEHPATQSHVHIGLPTIARDHPDYFPLLVGNYTLGGGGFVSRLMKEVREKRGFAYSVHSYYAARKLEGPFEIGLQTKRDQAQAAIKVVEQVLDDFVAKGPTRDELAAAKKNMVDGLALRLDSNAKLLGYLSLIGFYGLPLSYIDDFPASVRAVTAEQVRSVFARHVTKENLVTVIVAAD